MKILLTGCNGQVGWELERALASIGEVLAFDRQQLDLAKSEQIISRLREVRPDVIVNAAAYTAVDLAEKEPDLAMAINGTAPAILAEEAKRLGSLLMHYSTDYVFDGAKDSPYTEEDLPCPISTYGTTKLAGEEAVKQSGCSYIILRTSWVYAARGKNFLLTMLRLAKQGSELRIVDDQRGAPTWARDIARASAKILQSASGLEGIYHLTAAGDATWCDFARQIFRSQGLQIPLVPITSAEYSVAATRPANSLLSNEKLQRTFGLSLQHWSASLSECLGTSARGAGNGLR